MSIYMQLKYTTKLKDKELLKKAFKRARVSYREYSGEFVCNIMFYELHLKKNNEGEYTITTSGYNDWKDDIVKFRTKITKCYDEALQEQIQQEIEERLRQQELMRQQQEMIRKQTLLKHQEEICNEIKNNVSKNSSMSLVNEEILEDDSVVLTISI